MQQTLEDVLKGLEKEESTTDIANFLRDKIKAHDKEKYGEVITRLDGIEKNHIEIKDLLQKIFNKPEKEYPSFPETMKMDRPDWYKEPIEPVDNSIEWMRNISNSIRYDGEKTREILQSILEKEPEEKEIEQLEKPEPKTVNSAAVRSRRTTQWRSASTQLGNIIGTFDGVNKVFYAPDSFIPRSETIRLNGGIPLLTDDYSVSGNKITFVLAPVIGSTCEIRYQVK